MIRKKKKISGIWNKQQSNPEDRHRAKEKDIENNLWKKQIQFNIESKMKKKTKEEVEEE